MKILVVSFDRNLLESLKEALKDFEVITVKNGEEALNTVFVDIDVIIYDAIAGAISENDINKMYREKFKNSRYVILTDTLFPVDVNNIEPPNKIIIDRESGIENIVNAVIKEKPESLFVEEQVPTMYEFEGFEEKGEVVEEERKSKPFKLLVVSFDEELINKLSSTLGENFDIVTATNKKEILEKVFDTDIVIFDAIYGSMTQRILTDLSKEDIARSKPFIILMDDLFPIDTENVPLPIKYTFARESEFEKAIEQIRTLVSSSIQTSTLEYSLEEKTTGTKEEDFSIEDIFATLIKEKGKIETIAEFEEEAEVKEVKEEKTELSEQISESLYETVKEEGPIVEKMLTETVKQIESKLVEAFDLSIKQAIGKIDLGPVVEAISSNISKYLESINVENLVKKEIEKLISNVDVAEIIREEARRLLKEKLEELIT